MAEREIKTEQDFASEFLGWTFHEDGNPKWPRSNWLDIDSEEIKCFNALLETYGREDFARAVKIRAHGYWKWRSSKYLETLLCSWGEYRITFLESVSLETWEDEDIPKLLKEWGKILTFGTDIEQIKELFARFPAWWVKRALQSSIGRDIGNIRYVKAILYNWETAGGPDAIPATKRQRDYIEGLLNRSGRTLEEFTETPLTALLAEEASRLIPFLKELPKKPKEPRTHEMRISKEEWCESLVHDPDCEGIYFIQQEPIGPKGGPIKIGVSTNIKGRLTALQTANPNKLYLIAIVPQGDKKKALEDELHKRFNELNLFSEWFKAGELLVSYIEGLPTFTGWDNEEQA